MKDIRTGGENKLLKLLSSLTSKELKQFSAFLDSGLVNVNARTQTLFNLLQQGFSENDKEKIFTRIFGNEKYDDKKVRYLFSDLTGLAEEFITLNSFLNEKKLKQTILARELAARDCGKNYNAVLRDFEKEAEEEKVRDADFYYYQYYFEHTHLSLEIARQKRNEGTNIESVLENLDKFYLARKLQLCCEVYNVKNVLSINYKAFLLDEILEYLSKNRYEDTPAIIVYYQILMTLLESDQEDHFKKLRSLLIRHEENFLKSELREMYQYVLNYCIKKINTGNLNYQKELFDTYKIIIDNEVILMSGHFSQWDFKNIVTISCRLKEFEWAEKFVQSNKMKLKPEERDNAVSYNLAYLKFQKKNFPAALGMLQKVEFTDMYYQLDAKVILLKIYFEQGDEEHFEYHTSAFKIYLKRNKLISEYQRTIYSNLIRYSSLLLRYAGNAKKLSEVKAEIEGNRQVADLQWLLSRVGEMA